MSRHLQRGFLGAVVLVLACQTLGAPAPAQGQNAAEDANAVALKERDRLWDETRKLRAAGKTAEAIAAAEAMLAIERKVLPEGHADLAGSLGWLAELHVEREDFAAAIAAQREALAILRKRRGESDWRVIDARWALTDVERLAGMDRDPRARLAEAGRLNRTVENLYRAGRYAEAMPAALQALAIRKAVLGARHPDTATSLNNLAALLYAQGDYAAARPLLEQALAIRKAVLGARQPDTATSLNNLAALLYAQGDYAAARPLLEQALAIRKAVLGARQPDTATSLNNLAALLYAQGDYAAAKPLLEQALAIRKAVYGEHHPDTATSLNNLAELLEAQGDYAAAQPLYEQALAIDKEAPEKHPGYTTDLNNLAGLLYKQGDYAAAQPLLEQALLITKAALGERHPDTALRLSNLAYLLVAQGDYVAAKPLFEQAVDISRHNLDLAAAAQTERQQLAMPQALRYGLDAYLSLTQQARLPAAAYRYVLAWKGAVFQRQRHTHAAWHTLLEARDPELVRRLTALQDTTRQLATLALATSDPRQLPAWRRRIAELTARKEQLEGELAGQSAAFRAQRMQEEMSPAQVQAALPRDAALIDFLEYTQFRPPPGGKGDLKRERRLLAFVVRPDRPLALLDLGAVSPIAAAVERWLATRGRRMGSDARRDPRRA